MLCMLFLCQTNPICSLPGGPPKCHLGEDWRRQIFPVRGSLGLSIRYSKGVSIDISNWYENCIKVEVNGSNILCNSACGYSLGKEVGGVGTFFLFGKSHLPLILKSGDKGVLEYWFSKLESFWFKFVLKKIPFEGFAKSIWQILHQVLVNNW